MSAEVIIPKQRNYKIAPGHYEATIKHVMVKRAKSGKGRNCCISFEVKVPGMDRYECCARAVLPLDLNPNSPLRQFLGNLVGEDYFLQNSGLNVDLSPVLMNKRCEIDIEHGEHDSNKFDYPMVVVTDVKLAEAEAR